VSSTFSQQKFATLLRAMLSFCIHWIMDADDSVNDWSSDDESERQLCNDSSLNIEPACGARLVQQSQRRPARKTLPFVPYADWAPDQSYDELPPSCIHYIMEWKLTLNRRLAAKQTEDDIIVAPSDFWNEELSSKIADIVKSMGKSCEADATTITISVNDRSEHDITKRFEKLEIDWPIAETTSSMEPPSPHWEEVEDQRFV
jgi:hypothetical protein